MQTNQQPTLSDTIEDINGVDTWNNERTQDQLQSFIETKFDTLLLSEF